MQGAPHRKILTPLVNAGCDLKFLITHGDAVLVFTDDLQPGCLSITDAGRSYPRRSATISNCTVATDLDTFVTWLSKHQDASHVVRFASISGLRHMSVVAV